MSIQYNYPVEQLDALIEQLSNGITPMMSDALKAEVQLRYQELQHEGYDDEDDEDYRSAVQKHEDAMKAIEDNRRRSHSRNIMILDLTDAEKQKLSDDMDVCYIRSDPNSTYNLSDEDISEDVERRRIYKQLQSIGKIYYHQEDYRNAINIIHEAIEYSLKHDYPWMTYEEACEEFRKGRIKFTFSQLPLLYIDYHTQITDPTILAGIVKGEVNLIDKDEKPAKKKKKKDEVGISVPYSVIGPYEHAEYVKRHQAGWDSPISPILKSCSTIYNRYVMPSSLTFGNQSQQDTLPEVDWTMPGAGEAYFNAKHGIQKNAISEVVSLLNDANDGKLRQTIGMGMKSFLEGWNQQPQTFRSISTSLQQNDKVAEIESKILGIIRQSNPGL